MQRLTGHLKSWAASELKYWELAALEKVASGKALKTEDFRELSQYFVEDAGLVPIPAGRPRLSFSDSGPSEPVPPPCRLDRVFGLKNVNALAEGQEIHFGPQLTLLYGNNGAGKSGYVRALGSAGFARGERQVLPNASGKDSRNPPQANIELSYAGTSNKSVVTWTEGRRCPELSGFYVFDGNSLAAHLTGSNSLSFSPGGLSLLTTLAEVTDEVRARIRVLIDQREVPHNFQAYFEGDSTVKNLIATLDARTELDPLRKLAELSSKEMETIDSLEKEIAGLRLLNVPKQIEKRRREIRDLNNLVRAIEQAQADLGDSVVIEINALIDEVRGRREEAESSGVSQFQFESFTQIGSSSWRQFLSSAKALADAEATRGAPYPGQGDHCLLCRQSLPNEAIELIKRLWAFLESDSQGRLQAAQRALVAKVQQLDRINLAYFATDSNARRLLDEDLRLVVPAIEAQNEACAARRRDLIQSLGSNEVRMPAPLIAIDLTDVKNLTSTRDAEIERLEKSDTAQRLADAERSLRELRHRLILRERLPDITSYAEQKKWAVKARQSLGSTRIITTKYNQLFEELVTERYRRLFEETLARFGSGMQVTVETKGFKGETVRHIVLSPKSYRSGFSVEQILSDGEKRAVAMADFLTESALDDHAAGLILDDPVTSLDDDWKNTLARCLAEISRKYQVVVFTHDLSFLYRMNERAGELSIDVVTHWIRGEDGRPGFVYLNNSPVCERDFRSTKVAMDWYSKSKNSPPAQQFFELQQGFGALRTSYEALVIFDIFNEVVARFGERISFGRLKEVCVEPGMVSEIVRRMEVLSGYINAHLHSDVHGSTKLTPELLLEEIEAFESIRQRLKKLKNAAKVPAAGNSGETTQNKPAVEKPN
jgi:DNA repair exonuclease SbcCD ATPase subunit